MVKQTTCNEAAAAAAHRESTSPATQVKVHLLGTLFELEVNKLVMFGFISPILSKYEAKYAH